MQDNELLEKYNEICDNVSNIIKKGFDSEPVFNDKCFIDITKIKTKTKYYEGEINTNFHNDKMPKEGSQCICLSVLLIDYIFQVGKNYYPQVFLE